MLLLDDVRRVTARGLRRSLGYLPDIIVGSPPCQDFSAANGAAKGLDGERGQLVLEAVRLVGECRPAWFCLENSPRLRLRGADRVLAELEAVGFTAWPLVVGSVHAGAPHRRQRLWLCGVRGDLVERAAAANDNRPAPGAPGADAGRSRLPLDQGGAGDAGAGQCPAAFRVDWFSAWAHWLGGCARYFGMADRVPSWLARRCIAAYGDAVQPQLARLIVAEMAALVPSKGRALDLFAGAAGGWSQALHACGLETVAAVEVDPWRRLTFARLHRANMARQVAQPGIAANDDRRERRAAAV